MPKPQNKYAYLHAVFFFAWALPAAFAVYSACDINFINAADVLADLRVTQDIFRAVASDIPIAWIQQEASRYFPNQIISCVAYLLVFGDPAKWAMLFALLNLGLLYAATVFLLSVYGVAEPKRSLIACSFVLGCLACTAISPYFSHQLLAPTHHNTLLPLSMLFYAAPLLCSRLTNTASMVAYVLGFSLVFGLTIQTNKLFLVWACAPFLITLFILWLLQKCSIRALIACSVILGASLVIAGIIDVVLEALPFLDINRSALKLPDSIEEVIRRTYVLVDRVYSPRGSLILLVIQLVAAVICAGTFWQARRSRDETVQNIALTIALLFFVTTAIIPLALVVADKLSNRYFTYAFVMAILAISTNAAVYFERSKPGTSRLRWVLVAVLFTVAFPVLASKAIHRHSAPPLFSTLIDTLQELHRQGKIGRHGLAHYWVAHPVTTRTRFHVGAIGGNATPRLFANNAYLYWDWSTTGCPSFRNFSFVVTAQRPSHRISPSAIKKVFGKPSEIVKVKGPGGYEVWLYPEGIKARKQFYRSIARGMKAREVSMKQIRRCASK